MIPARLIAFNHAPEMLFAEGKEQLSTLFPNFDFDYEATHPLLLYFLSGGSERFALEAAQNAEFCLLMAGESNNAYAAAGEVKARLDQLGIDSLLTDCGNETDRKTIESYLRIFNDLEKLRNKKLGLIGNPSDWLVASGIEEKLMAERFGVQLQKIGWDTIPDYRQQQEDEQFLEKFQNRSALNLSAASCVSSALQTAIGRNGLDAITVECFPMVQKDGVTACLALSHLNDNHLPAGCEGDLTSILGMMLLQAVTGTIPWMANLIQVSDKSVRFAHCTAPTGLLTGFTVDTHFETGKGTAVAGYFAEKEVTVFRMNNTLDKAFLAQGEIVAGEASPKNACRTLIEVRIPMEKIRILKAHPLGNHHLIVPGNHIEKLMHTLRLKGFSIQ